LVTRTPDGEVVEGDAVTVSVDVSDGNTGVEEVILSYTDGVAWHNTTMGYSEALEAYTGEVGEQEAGGTVSYRILTRDAAGNWAVDDNSGELYSYEVAAEVEEEPPEPSGERKLVLSPPLIAMAAASVIVVAALAMFLRRMRSL